ncbi:GGDEF domain-containing protein [Stakelama pacifica]|uniref:diguanylate cyclase n=1 Tax=Stakelama pacifica TaxID=517720 RepID=A0A4R6FD40_9SPHN|nr:GGDEF domain-containing protein [Stakelama pacifica]TDN78204.1 diguanylate cyclase (GGDEF)-like protein [Stakelama pacifica]GGO99999.1 hypothetical protein GCM10011329_34810 [Stakelama pacifica]
MNSNLPVGRLADRLHSMPRERAWFAILLSVTALALADAHFPRIGLAPFYIPIVCAACWALGSRAGYLVAVVAAVLAVVPHLAELPRLSPALLGARMAVRAVTYVFLAAIVLSFRRSFDREHHLAARDRMTDALNKETFRERVIHRLDLAVPARQSFLLAILDLDDFKGLNNRHGHVAGDEVLRTFAQGARGIIRREDDFGRIGGDEFAFLLPVHSAEEGVYFARSLHKRLSSVLVGTPHPVTCSMGALLIPPDTPRDEPSLMHAVDQLMYAVKRAGKNAVEIGRATTDRALDTPLPSRPRVPIEACL